MTTETPIIDSMCSEDYVDTGWLLDAARKLERDRAALIAALAELVAESENDFHHASTCGFELARATLAAVQS